MVSDTITVGTSPYGVSVSPNGAKVYVANAFDNSVSVIDTATNIVTDIINGFTYPISLGIFIAQGSSIVPCFAKGTKILCLSKETGKEEYKLIESLRKGDLVKTLKHGFVAIHMIGYQDMYNAASDNHNERMLYKCSRDQYPEVLEDLIITGHHSILVDRFKEGERAKTEKVLGDIYVTDQKYRLPACVDKRAIPYQKEGMFTVFHFSLENDNDYMNYGVYANGLLVETTSKRYLRDLSGMRFP